MAMNEHMMAALLAVSGDLSTRDDWAEAATMLIELANMDPGVLAVVLSTAAICIAGQTAELGETPEAALAAFEETVRRSHAMLSSEGTA